MSKILAYLRASTNKQEVSHQKYEILEYARKHDMKVDQYIELIISSKRSVEQRRINEISQNLNASDVLIVTELSRLGRSTTQVLSLVNTLVDQQIRIIVIKQNLDISKHDVNSKMIVTLFSLFAELERDFVSMRTKEALASKKAQGIKLGKPKGTIQKSKFDQHRERVVELLELGLSVRKIAKLLGYTSHIALNTYIKKRNLRP